MTAAASGSPGGGGPAAPLPAEAAGEHGVSCPSCTGPRSVRWGQSGAGTHRFRCALCARTFSAETGTLLASVRAKSAFAAVLDDMMAGVRSSCRHLALLLGVDKTTVWRWRRLINEALADASRQEIEALCAGERRLMRESRKASREWVDHRHDPAHHPAPDRPRWVDVDSGLLPPPQPLERFLVSVLLAGTPTGTGAARVLGVGLGTPWARGPWRSVVSDDVVQPERNATGFHPARAVAMQLSATPVVDDWRAISVHPAARASPGHDGVGQLPEGATRSSSPAALRVLRQHFDRFIKPFRGPATRHLEGYAAWFTIGQGGTKESRVATAWAALAAARPARSAAMN